MDAAFLNSLVGDYLSSFGSKLADKFKKETKSTPLPPGSPSLAEMVKHFKETSPAKRKLSMTNGASPAKKAKKVRTSAGPVRTTCWCWWRGWRVIITGVASYKHCSVCINTGVASILKLHV